MKIELCVRELSFLMLGTEVEEFLDECKIYLSCFLGCQIFFPTHDGVEKV